MADFKTKLSQNIIMLVKYNSCCLKVRLNSLVVLIDRKLITCKSDVFGEGKSYIVYQLYNY